LRAVTEAIQARLNFIAGSRDDIFRTAFVRARTDFGRAVEVIQRDRADCVRAETHTSRAANTFEEDIAELLNCVRKTGLHHVVVADLTPADFPVHVVRVIIPGFEGYMHHGYRPGKRAHGYASAEAAS